MIRGHGRKGDANLCGIMRNDYNILLRLLRLTRKLPRLSLLNVHYQRFGESLRIVQDKLDSKNFYAFNPEFDRKPCCN